MLVLSRKMAERIYISIGEVTVIVEVVRIRGDKVYLGVEAPLEIAVHREEVANAIAAGVPRKGEPTRNHS